MYVDIHACMYVDMYMCVGMYVRIQYFVDDYESADEPIFWFKKQISIIMKIVSSTLNERHLKKHE